MTPDDRARRRYATLTLLRAGGVVVMLLGLAIWHGGLLRRGGWPEVGGTIFAVGVLDSLLLPHLLRRRWRTPPS